MLPSSLLLSVPSTNDVFAAAGVELIWLAMH